MEKSKFSAVLHLVTRYWFIFLVVAATNAIIRLSGVILLNHSVFDWALSIFVVFVFALVMARIDIERARAESGHPSPSAKRRLRALVWVCSATLAAISTLSLFGMLVFTNLCEEKTDRNQCRSYEAILESRNGPIKQVIFMGWAWKPCARCYGRGEINAPALSFNHAIVSRSADETVRADVSVETVIGNSERFLARLIKDEPVHAQDIVDSMTSVATFACLKPVEKWRYPRQVSSVEFSCNREAVPFWTGKVTVKNIVINAN